MRYDHHMCLVCEPHKGQSFWNYHTNKLCVMVDSTHYIEYEGITDIPMDFTNEMLFNINFGYHDDEPHDYKSGQILYKDGKRYYVDSTNIPGFNEPEIAHIEGLDVEIETDLKGYDDSYSPYLTAGRALEFLREHGIHEYTPVIDGTRVINDIYALKFKPDMFKLSHAYEINSPSICFEALLVSVDSEHIEFVRVYNGKIISFTMRPDMVYRFDIKMKLIY